MFMCLKEGFTDISIVVKCYASDVIEYNRRRAELSSAPLQMKQDTNSIPV